jgi:serine/threonine protein kinase
MTSRAFSAEHFEFLSVERPGGMSKIKKAVLKESNQLCALKYAKWSSEDDAAAATFNRELEALENLSHKHVVKLVGVGSDGTQRFLVLEWLEETLLDRIQRLGAIDWQLFYEMIGRPLLEGIQYAHSRRRIHRDLKPLNVMFDASNVAKITDFGIAKDLDDIRPGMSFNRVGTPPWTPSEVDDHIHSEGRDLYSLCLMPNWAPRLPNDPGHPKRHRQSWRERTCQGVASLLIRRTCCAPQIGTGTLVGS